MYCNCVSLCSLCEGKEGQRQFTYRLFLLITGIKTKMLLWLPLYILGIIAKLTSDYFSCDIRPVNVTGIDWIEVGIALR
jgi:hypothetical protein